MSDDARERAPAEEYIEYQQNEIDSAAETIDTRREHLGNYRQDGLLDGDFVNERDNERFKAYLQGYADACEFAQEQVQRIDNLVKYAIEHDGTADARPAAEQATVYRCHACERPTAETSVNDECPLCGTPVDWQQTPEDNGGDA